MGAHALLSRSLLFVVRDTAPNRSLLSSLFHVLPVSEQRLNQLP